MNMNVSTIGNAAGLHPDYKNEIIEIIRSNLTPRIMREKIGEYHENDIAEALDLLKKDERHKLYSILNTQMLADILEYSPQCGKYIDELGIRKRVEILSCLEITTAVEYLKNLEKCLFPFQHVLGSLFWCPWCYPVLPELRCRFFLRK